MSRSSQPTRLPADVYESASAAASITSRTVPQQLAHWVRLGRELEMSPGVNHRLVSKVLAGEESYDSLGEEEQALVRADWAQRMESRVDQLDYVTRFDADGDSYSEIDENGDVAIRPAP